VEGGPWFAYSGEAKLGDLKKKPITKFKGGLLDRRKRGGIFTGHMERKGKVKGRLLESQQEQKMRREGKGRHGKKGK